MLKVGGLFLNIFEREKKKKKKKKKNRIFNLWQRAHLVYKMNPIKIYKEWANLNTVKISFCKVAVTLINFAIKDVKMTKKRKKWLPYLYLAPYNTR